MFIYLKLVSQLLKKDLLVATPAIIFYLVIIMFLNGRDPQLLMDDKNLLMTIGALSTVVVVFLQLFVAQATLQLTKLAKVNFSEAVKDSLKKYLKTLFLYIVLVSPLDALSLVTANTKIVGTLVLFMRILFYLVIAPSIVLSNSVREGLKMIFSVFHFRKVFEIFGLISFILLIAIFLVMVVSLTKIVFLIPFVLGFITTYLNMAVFLYMYQDRGKVC